MSRATRLNSGVRQADATTTFVGVVKPSGDTTGATDAAAINAALAGGGKRVTLQPGATYYCNAPVYLTSHSVLDATGANINLVSGVLVNLLRNKAVDPIRTTTDAVTTLNSTTLTSATANFTSADVGRAVGVVGGGLSGMTWYGTISSVTNATTVAISVPARATLSGGTLNIFGDRDTDITVRGGTWTTPDLTGAGAHNAATTAYNSFCAMLRRIDGLRLQGMNWASGGAQGLGGRFTVSLADVTKFYVNDIQFNGTGGDGVHVTGPSQQGEITNIRGTTGDDMVVLNTQDLNTPYIMDTQGNLYDISTRGIVAKDTHNCFKIYDIGPANQYQIQRCSVDGISGSSLTSAVQITGQPNIDTLSIRNVAVYTHTSPMIDIGNDGGASQPFSAASIGAISVENVEYVSVTSASSGIVRVNQPRGRVRVRNVNVTGQPTGTNYGVYITGAVGPASGGAYGSSLDISEVYAVAGAGVAPATFHPVYLSTSGRFQAVSVSRVHNNPTTTGTVLTVATATTFDSLHLADIESVGQYVVSLPTGQPATKVGLVNVRHLGTNVVTTAGPATVMLANVDANTSGAIVAATGGATPVHAIAAVVTQSGAGAALATFTDTTVA